MSKKAIFGIGGIMGIFTLIVLIAVITLIGARNTAVSLDEQVKAQHTANKSNYDNMWKSFVEATQVTEKQATQFKDVYDGMINGRYENDEDLLFKMVQEQNPQLSQEVYTQLQNLIISGRKDFDNNQKRVTDVIREYNTYIRKHFIMNAVFQFPVLDANDFIVTSERTTDAFESNQDDVIDLNGSK